MIAEKEVFAKRGRGKILRRASVDDPIQKSIVQACAHPQSIDELVAQLAISLPELQAHLFDLQVAGLLEQDFAGMWRCV